MAVAKRPRPERRRPEQKRSASAVLALPEAAITMSAQTRARITKNAAFPPRFSIRCAAARLRLRLRLQAGIRIGPRARLAGRGHGGGARRGGLEHGLAVRLLALEQIDDLVAAQRLELEQALGKRFEVGALLGEDAGRLDRKSVV